MSVPNSWSPEASQVSSSSGGPAVRFRGGAYSKM
jgi:hypothetical protein